MGTVIRPEVSKENKYYIPRHRYYELKHFCMQYKDFKKVYNELCSKIQSGVLKIGDEPAIEDKTLYIRQRYLDKITVIEESARLTDDVLGAYILKGVTEGLPYTYFKTMNNIPCCKDTYYELYRKFFWILHHKKNA